VTRCEARLPLPYRSAASLRVEAPAFDDDVGFVGRVDRAALPLQVQWIERRERGFERCDVALHGPRPRIYRARDR
jgi:hypothetical protein